MIFFEHFVKIFIFAHMYVLNTIFNKSSNAPFKFTERYRLSNFFFFNYVERNEYRPLNKLQRYLNGGTLKDPVCGLRNCHP